MYRVLVLGGHFEACDKIKLVWPGVPKNVSLCGSNVVQYCAEIFPEDSEVILSDFFISSKQLKISVYVCHFFYITKKLFKRGS